MLHLKDLGDGACLWVKESHLEEGRRFLRPATSHWIRCEKEYRSLHVLGCEKDLARDETLQLQTEFSDPADSRGKETTRLWRATCKYI